MAFNSATYRMNKDRREAWAHLAKAREVKADIASGKLAASWAWKIESQVRHARISMMLFRSARRIARLDSRSAVR